MSDQIHHYMTLQYHIEMTPDADGGYVVEHPDLPGCAAQGETPDEAVAALDRARREWIEGRLETGLSVPEPTSLEEYSGKFLLRLPRSVHAQLARRAMGEGVSLNQYVNGVLARHLGSAPLETVVERLQERLEQTISDLRITARQNVAILTTEVGGPSTFYRLLAKTLERTTVGSTYGDPDDFLDKDTALCGRLGLWPTSDWKGTVRKQEKV